MNGKTKTLKNNNCILPFDFLLSTLNIAAFSLQFVLSFIPHHIFKLPFCSTKQAANSPLSQVIL